MRKTILRVLIALHFAEMTVLELLPFARSIHDNAGADPDVTIDPLLVADLDGKTVKLTDTVTLRKTNKSKALTTLQGTQATDVILVLTDIATTVEKQANAIAPGDIARATLAIERIGFSIEKAPVLRGRSFEVYRTEPGAAYVRVKDDEDVYLHHWRFSYDGINWTRLPDTKSCNICIFNLIKVKIVYFQKAETMKIKGIIKVDANGFEPIWSDSISATIPA